MALPAAQETPLANERRIFGPPGTGKTTHLADLVGKYTTSKKYRPAEIFITSFTKTAAAEIASRGTGIPEENIQTLHAAGYHALGRGEIAETHIAEWNKWVAEKGARQFQLSDARGNLEGADLGTDDSEASPGKSPFIKGDDIFSQMMRARAHGHDGRQSTPLVKKLFFLWGQWKKENEFIDFQDMIDLPFQRELLPQNSPKVIIGDEFQDFTYTEARLARFWGSHVEELILAGDDDQCLYAFKGASAANFINPPLPADQMHVLSQSYRVPRAVQAYAERWIKKLETRRQPKEYRPRREELKGGGLGAIIEGEVRFATGAKVGVTAEGVVAASWQDPQWYLDDAQRYLSQGKKVMFLASCAYMLDPLRRLLRDEGIPFHNPFRTKRTDWNPLNAATKGTSSTDRLLAFLRPSASAWGENEARIWTIEDFRLWVSALEKKGVLRLHGQSSAAIEQYYTELVDTDPTALEQSLDVIDHLSEWMHEEALQHALNQSLDWFEKKLLGAKAEGMKYPLSVARKHGGAALREKPNVILGTIHSVKGGAADVVYLFPDISRRSIDDLRAESGRDSMVRLFYVGMTRARESLILGNAADEKCEFFPKL